MTDVAFVAGAYVVVIGGLLLYALSLGRRLRQAHRLRETVRRQLASPDEARVQSAEQSVSPVAVVAPPP